MLRGLPFPAKSMPRRFATPHAAGKRTAEQQNVSRFFSPVANPVRCMARTSPQTRTDARMKWTPFFWRRAQSVLSSSSSIFAVDRFCEYNENARHSRTCGAASRSVRLLLHKMWFAGGGPLDCLNWIYGYEKSISRYCRCAVLQRIRRHGAESHRVVRGPEGCRACEDGHRVRRGRHHGDDRGAIL